MDTQRANPINPLRILAIAAGFALLCPAQPAQAHVGLAVTFDNIGINSLMQLTSGEVKVVRNALNLQLFGDIQPPTPSEDGDPTNPNDTTIYPPPQDTIVVESLTLDSVVVIDDNTVVIYPPNGAAPITVDLGGSTCTLLVPSDGNMDNAKVVYDGAVHPYNPNQGGSGGNGMNGASGFLAHFKPNNTQVYGFDSMRYEQYTSFYQEMEINGKPVKLPWKALELGRTDPVNLSIQRSSGVYPYSNLRVGALGGADLMPTAGSDTPSRTYSLTGVAEGEEAIVATYQDSSRTKFAGGLWTATYERKPFKLYLVPMPGITVTDVERGTLQQNLNAGIFSQAVVSWTVGALPGLTGVDLGENGLDWAGKELLSSYNAEMNGVISAFKAWKPDADAEAYYLFVVPKFSESGVEGFMPRSRRFGFVTQEQLKDRTVAHELGHGAFNLRHTFPEVAQGTTDNLMDYSNGVALYKPQWDLIHNPEFTTGLWDGMEDGAAIGTLAQVKAIINKIRTANSVSIITTDPQPIVNTLDLAGLGTKSNSDTMKIEAKERQLTVDLSFTSSSIKINDPTTFVVSSPILENGVNYITLKFSNDATNILTIKCLESDLLPVIRYIMHEDDLSPIVATSDGKYLKNGGIAYITNDANNGDPKMPKLSFKYISDLGQIQMKLEIIYNQKFNSGNPEKPYNLISDTYDEIGKNVLSNTEWKPSCSSIIGGNATLTWNDIVKSGSFKFNIRGINPTKLQIVSYLEQIQLKPTYWFILGKLMKESSQMQFNYSYSAKNFQAYDESTYYSSDNSGLRGLPYYGPPNGWGLGQLDNWKENGVTTYASTLGRWSWKENLNKVRFILEANKSVVVNKMNEYLTLIRDWESGHKDEKDKVLGHSDKIEGGYTFSHINSSLFPSIDLGKTDVSKKSFIDALYIKMFNSGVNRLYYQIKQDVDPITKEKMKPEWVIDDQACYGSNCWDYVNDVCNLNN